MDWLGRTDGLVSGVVYGYGVCLLVIECSASNWLHGCKLASAMEFKGHYWTESAYGIYLINLDMVSTAQLFCGPHGEIWCSQARQHGLKLNEARFTQLNVRQRDSINM
jgi:hypothetical protein